MQFLRPVLFIGIWRKCKVRDLVKHNDLGSFSGTFEQTLPAHSAMFLRMEGETRLEPTTLYEAEWAYLPLSTT